MKSNEHAVLVLSYKMTVNDKLVTIKRLWYPDADDAKENMAAAINESASGFIQMTLKKTFEV